jgi:two-component system, sensor histidine kinase and response regulator
MEPYKILVVDDNSDYAVRIIELLKETDKSFNFFMALNGKIAYSIAEKKIPDLIITDWEMPVMDGIEFIKYLKSNKQTSDIPVIMCTGVMTQTENLETALNAGAVDYIRKPVEKHELIARVHSML